MARYPQTVLVSCEIPWDDKEQLLEEVFRREVRSVLEHFNHLYIFGTAKATPWTPRAFNRSCRFSKKARRQRSSDGRRDRAIHGQHCRADPFCL